MDREYVWGAECGGCSRQIFRNEVPVGCTLEDWLRVHKEMECLAQVGPRLPATGRSADPRRSRQRR